MDMDGESLDIKEDNIQKLKNIFPGVFSENELDWEKLKAVFGDQVNFSNERYTLNWAGKAESFKILQQTTSSTLQPVIEESIDFETADNVFIEGENLEV